MVMILHIGGCSFTRRSSVCIYDLTVLFCMGMHDSVGEHLSNMLNPVQIHGHICLLTICQHQQHNRHLAAEGL